MFQLLNLQKKLTLSLLLGGSSLAMGATEQEKKEAAKLIKGQLGGLMALMCQQNPNQSSCKSLMKKSEQKVLEPGEMYKYKGIVYLGESKHSESLKPYNYRFTIEGIKIGGKKGTRLSYTIGGVKGKAEAVHNGYQIINISGLAKNGLADKENLSGIRKQQHDSAYTLAGLVIGATGFDIVKMTKTIKFTSKRKPEVAKRFSTAKVGGVEAVRYQRKGTNLYYSEILAIPLLKTEIAAGGGGEKTSIELVSYSKN